MQHIIEKQLSNIISIQSKDNGMKISDNTHVNENVNMFENNSKSKGNSSKDVDGQTKMGNQA